MRTQTLLMFLVVLVTGAGCKRSDAPSVETESESAPVSTAQRGCTDGMVSVPAGEFVSGARGEEIDFYPEWPGIEHLPRPRATRETGAFCIDRYEYPNRKGRKPVAYVSWDDAVRLCEELGKRLCTEDEWAKACGGVDGWLFPYGNEYRLGVCHADVTEGVGDGKWLEEAGSFPECVSPGGAVDMEGNLSEWVDATPADDDPELRIVRGGTMWVGVYGRGCMARHRHYHTDATHEDDGFRCCADLGE